jgi:hypothetical protein
MALWRMFGSKGEKHQEDVKNTYAFYDLCSSEYYFDNKIKGGTFVIMIEMIRKCRLKTSREEHILENKEQAKRITLKLILNKHV